MFRRNGDMTMTKSDIKAIIDGLEAKKAEYEGIKAKLEDLLEGLQEQKLSLDEGIMEPIAEPYPLAGESGEDWSGENYRDAEEKRGAIATALGSYDAEIGTLMSEISEAIGEIEEKISELAAEIASWWDAYATAPEVEPEDNDYDD